MAAIPPPRRTLAQQIDQFFLQDDFEAIDKEMAELQVDLTESEGFRHSAPSTQARQDRHLELYRSFARAVHHQQSTLCDEETDALAFPTDEKRLIILAKNFIVYVFKHAQSRAIGEDKREKIKYRTLTQYRDSLMFWVRRTYDLRDGVVPNANRLFNKITESMRHAQRKYSSPDRRMHGSGLGLIELQQLLEYEMTTAKYIEYSEQHQVIWCIARQTAVRPGSIGWTTGRPNNYLRWEDLQFINHSGGRFTCIIDFKNLKTNYADPEKGEWRTLTFHCNSPTAENIMFSIPHRLLTIAIRRTLIEGIETMEDLLSTDLARVTIKAQHLKDPVFYAGLPAGRGLNMDRSDGKPNAMPSESLTTFLRDRGRALGYTVPITMYSFRRRVASDMAARIGTEATREIMGHDADTRTLERYYLNLQPYRDNVAVALGELIGPGGISEDAVSQHAPIADSALSTEAMEGLRGAALNNLVDEMSLNDPHYDPDADKRTMDRYLKRLRAHAMRILTQQAAAHHAKTQTLSDKAARQQALVDSAANFARAIRDAAVAHAASERAQTSEDPQALADEESPGTYAEQFQRGKEPGTTHEEDAEEVAENATETTVVRHVTGEEFSESQETARPGQLMDYLIVARSFMEVLHGGTMVVEEKKTWADQKDKTCPMCQSDATISREVASKEWSNAQALKDHMASGQYHSPYGRWQRLQKARAEQALAEDPENEKPFACPYDDCEATFPSFGTLAHHIKAALGASNPQKPKHHASIVADGWQEPDWKGVPHIRTLETRARETFRAQQRAGISIQKRVHAKAFLDPEMPNLSWGDVGPEGNQVLPEHAPFIDFGEPVGRHTEVHPEFDNETFMTWGEARGPILKPAEFADDITYGHPRDAAPTPRDI